MYVHKNERHLNVKKNEAKKNKEMKKDDEKREDETQKVRENCINSLFRLFFNVDIVISHHFSFRKAQTHFK